MCYWLSFIFNCKQVGNAGFCWELAQGGRCPGVGPWASVSHSVPSGRWAGSLYLRDLLRGLMGIPSVQEGYFLSPLSGNLGPCGGVLVSRLTLKPLPESPPPWKVDKLEELDPWVTGMWAWLISPTHKEGPLSAVEGEGSKGVAFGIWKMRNVKD